MQQKGREPMTKEPMEEQEADLFWLKMDAMSEEEHIKLIIETYQKADKSGKRSILATIGAVQSMQQDNIKKRKRFKVVK